MKRYITMSLVLFAAIATNAQISIGKDAVNGSSALLDFYDGADNFRGIILPAVEAAPTDLTAANNGTFLFDVSEKKLKMYENEIWIDLSEEGDDTNLQINSSDENNQEQGAIIGSPSSDAKGVLVLESADKAMILPKIADPHTTVKSPYPGMMCYDTVSKSLAVFDGSVWNYWK